MACAKNPAITNYNYQTNNRNIKPQYNNNLIQYDVNYIESKCRTIKSAYPSFTPQIFNLSETSSLQGQYKVIKINGLNFLPSVYGTTYVNFENKFGYTNFKQLPIIFYNTSQISFVVPLNIVAGHYTVTVVNVYNSNFSPAINQTYSGNLNYSKKEDYYIISYF